MTRRTRGKPCRWHPSGAFPPRLMIFEPKIFAVAGLLETDASVICGGGDLPVTTRRDKPHRLGNAVLTSYAGLSVGLTWDSRFAGSPLGQGSHIGFSRGRPTLIAARLRAGSGSALQFSIARRTPTLTKNTRSFTPGM